MLALDSWEPQVRQLFLVLPPELFSCTVFLHSLAKDTQTSTWRNYDIPGWLTSSHHLLKKSPPVFLFAKSPSLVRSSSWSDTCHTTKKINSHVMSGNAAASVMRPSRPATWWAELEARSSSLPSQRVMELSLFKKETLNNVNAHCMGKHWRFWRSRAEDSGWTALASPLPLHCVRTLFSNNCAQFKCSVPFLVFLHHQVLLHWWPQMAYEQQHRQ